MNTDLNQTVVDFEKLVADLEKDKNDILAKVKELEGKLLTPENEQKLLDLLARLKALLGKVL